MKGKKQFRNLLLNIISRAATAALAIAVVFALTVVMSQSAHAQKPATGGGSTERVLYSFDANGVDGYDPWAGLIFDAAGNLYGTTAEGGTYGSCYGGCGTVFELTPTAGGGWAEQVLYSFGNGTDGAFPAAGLIFDAAGNLYGTTLGGGDYGYGTVFELTPTVGGGWTEQVLYSFNLNGTDGVWPAANLIFDRSGNLYSTTWGGGEYEYNCDNGVPGCGTVFELSPTAGGGWTEQVLWNFGNGTDGTNPEAGLIFDAAGNLYGTTVNGGTYDNCSYGGCGTVFELTPTAGGGWTEQVLHNFGNGTDGAYVYGGLIFDAAGNLYGTASGGGTYTSCLGGCGMVFELTSTGGGGWTETVLYSFGNGTDASAPTASLIFDRSGNLYGTTEWGGTYDNCIPPYGCGTVFELKRTAGGGWTEQVLHNFGNGADGTDPFAGLIFDAAGNLYGTTEGGGTYGVGTVFELTPVYVYPCAECSHSVPAEVGVPNREARRAGAGEIGRR